MVIQRKKVKIGDRVRLRSPVRVERGFVATGTVEHIEGTNVNIKIDFVPDKVYTMSPEAFVVI